MHEKISSLADGELSAQELSQLLANRQSLLNSEDGRRTWEIYHQIGELIKSDDATVNLSPEFSTGLSKRLAVEPLHLNVLRPAVALSRKYRYAYAAVASIAFILFMAPKFAGHEGAETSAPYTSAQFSASRAQPQVTLAAMSQNRQVADNRTANRDPQVQMLRDPALDSYLAAHQRYSSSMYSQVEYETDPIVQDVEKK